MSKLKYIGILVLAFCASGLSAQDGGLMYGKVTTRSGATYQGNIRWGGEEVFWTDEFNASKLDSKVFGYVIKDDEDDDEGISFKSIRTIWEDYTSGSVHEFSCQFGNMRKLVYKEDEKKAIITLKNGKEIIVGGSGYNDMKASITVLDEELGKIRIKGSNVESVEFMNTPERLDAKFGEALYGAVYTYEGDSIKGYIQYDKDERLSTDFLDGNSGSERLKIPMGKIVRIEPSRNGSKVELISGRRFNLSGTNDVSQGNRGVIVTIEGLGRTSIPWSDVYYVSFEKNNSSGQTYSNFKSPKGLSGEVITLNNRSYKGYFAYDRDEVWEFEFLDGESKNWELKVPFENIKSISPRNAKYSLVELKAGNKLLLGHSRDVSDSNGGILLFESRDGDPISIDWDDIDIIIFDEP